MTSSIAPTAVVPSLSRPDIEATAQRLAPFVVRTPTVTVAGERLGVPEIELEIKLEQLQTTNSFKFRGAMNHLLGLAGDKNCAGVVTVSSGNHGIAVAEAGRRVGARVVVLLSASANLWRREQIEKLGAETRVYANGENPFAQAAALGAREKLHFIHPYDGTETLLATATLGLEFCRQVEPLDAVVLPIGGGGLAAGTSVAFKSLQPTMTVYGAEPEGAPTITSAWETGVPVALRHMSTIADSLAAPMAAPMSLGLCRANLAEVLLLNDESILTAMRVIYSTLHQVVEPSAAITTAAVLGPLRERLAGKRVGLILCGANQDPRSQLEMLLNLRV